MMHYQCMTPGATTMVCGLNVVLLFPSNAASGLLTQRMSHHANFAAVPSWWELEEPEAALWTTCSAGLIVDTMHL